MLINRSLSEGTERRREQKLFYLDFCKETGADFFHQDIDSRPAHVESAQALEGPIIPSPAGSKPEKRGNLPFLSKYAGTTESQLCSSGLYLNHLAGAVGLSNECTKQALALLRGHAARQLEGTQLLCEITFCRSDGWPMGRIAYKMALELPSLWLL